MKNTNIGSAGTSRTNQNQQ